MQIPIRWICNLIRSLCSIYSAILSHVCNCPVLLKAHRINKDALGLERCLEFFLLIIMVLLLAASLFLLWWSFLNISPSLPLTHWWWISHTPRCLFHRFPKINSNSLRSWTLEWHRHRLSSFLPFSFCWFLLMRASFILNHWSQIRYWFIQQHLPLHFALLHGLILILENTERFF